MGEAYQRGFCVSLAGAIYGSVYAFSSRIQSLGITNLLTRSAKMAPHRWLDYVMWFACRGFCLFAFAVLSLLLIYGCKCFRERPTLAVYPVLLFLIINEFHRNGVVVRPDSTSFVVMEIIGIIVGIVYYVRSEIKKDKLAFASPN